MDPYMSIVYEVEMRFGMWDELLAEKAPPAYWPITTAMWHFARGTAYAAKGEIKDAEREQEEFAAAVKRVPEGAMMSINPAHKILSIADHVLAGEIAFRRGDVDVAVRELRAGAAIEDDLLYMEPPEWVQPVRHALGAVLESAGRCKDAEVVYREDLKAWPENGWALYGLSRCLRERGATAEADEMEKRFKSSWSRADTKIGASCVCVRTASAAGAGD
jgi:tetratricopeptide (TPR) repeat protein